MRPITERKPMEELSKGLKNVPIWLKLLSAGLACAMGGWSGHVIFAQQIGLPAVVHRTVTRVETLESRVEAMETFMVALPRLASKVDSMEVLLIDTYCVVRAHALDLDPTFECTLRIRDQ